MLSYEFMSCFFGGQLPGGFPGLALPHIEALLKVAFGWCILYLFPFCCMVVVCLFVLKLAAGRRRGEAPAHNIRGTYLPSDARLPRSRYPRENEIDADLGRYLYRNQAVAQFLETANMEALRGLSISGISERKILMDDRNKSGVTRDSPAGQQRPSQGGMFSSSQS